MYGLSSRSTLMTPVNGKTIMQLDQNKGGSPGNNCWVDPSGVAWYFGKQRKVLTADLSGSTSITLADVTGLGFAVAANTRYGFRFVLLYQQASTTTTGIAVGLTIPASPTVFSAGVEIFGRAANASSGASFEGVITASGGAVTSDQVAATATTYPAVVEGVLCNGTNAGTLQLQWAAEVAAAGAITPKQGSYGELWYE